MFLRQPAWRVTAALLISCGTASVPSTAPSRTVTAVPPATSSAPRATPSAGPARSVRLGEAILIDLPTEIGFAVAADDGAFGSVGRAQDGSTSLFVTELATDRRVTIATTPGRFVWLMPGGAVRKDLVTYFEQEERATKGGVQKVTWHVMVVNWRSGAPATELDAIDGEVGSDPHANNYMPLPATNGRDVIWLRAPRVDGKLGAVQVMRWSGGSTTAVYTGEASFAIDDAGRIAIDRVADANTGAAQLLLIEGGVTRRVATRAQSGPPYLAAGKIVWARRPNGLLATSDVDVVDIASGAMRALTYECPFVGATVRHVVYGCRDRGSRLVGVDDLTVLDIKDFIFRADPHAILGRDGAGDHWTVAPVAN